MSYRDNPNVTGHDDNYIMESQANQPYRDDPYETSGASSTSTAEGSSFQIRHSLPAPEDIYTERVLNTGRPHPNVSKKLLGLVTVSVFCLTAIIGLSVAIAARQSSHNVDRASNPHARVDETPGDERDPGRHPDKDVVSERFRNIANYLGQFSHVDVQLFTRMDSPQFQAVQWLAEQDPQQLEVPTSTIYSEAMNIIQRYVLAVFYYATQADGYSWINDLNFLSADDVCLWSAQVGMRSAAANENRDGWASGVRCNSADEVNFIFIPENGLTGSLPAELGLLVAMKQFSVYGNNLGGELPDSLQGWVELNLFSVSFNQIQGTIPTWMSAWSEMEYLTMGNNEFTGDLPDVFGGMEGLLEVAVNDNTLTGSFDRFRQNAYLEMVMLQNNQLSGTLSHDSFVTDRLRILDLSNNQIGGQFPEELYNVEMVALQHNRISGPLPSPTTSEHVIHFLSLFDNKLNGDLPINMGDLQQLRHLDVSFNELEGVIPDSLATMNALHVLYLGDNDFLSGEMPDLSPLRKLHELSLRGMNLQGTIPHWLGASLRNLVLLDLRDNGLSGEIPSGWANLGKMQFLLLSNNALTGAVPNELYYLQDLKILGLDHNGLSGPIGDICSSSGPTDLDWLVVDATVECDNCCTDQCEPNDSTACGGATLLSPNVEYGFFRNEYVFNANLVFDAGHQNIAI